MEGSHGQGPGMRHEGLSLQRVYSEVFGAQWGHRRRGVRERGRRRLSEEGVGLRASGGCVCSSRQVGLQLAGQRGPTKALGALMIPAGSLGVSIRSGHSRAQRVAGWGGDTGPSGFCLVPCKAGTADHTWPCPVLPLPSPAVASPPPSLPSFRTSGLMGDSPRLCELRLARLLSPWHL